MRNLKIALAVSGLAFCAACGSNLQGTYGGSVSGTMFSASNPTLSMTVEQNNNTVSGNWTALYNGNFLASGTVTGSFSNNNLTGATFTPSTGQTYATSPASATGNLNNNTLTLTLSGTGTSGTATLTLQ